VNDALLQEIAGLVSGMGTDPRAEAVRIVEAAQRDVREGELIAERARRYGEERASGRPLAYVVGFARFMGLELLAAPGALVPREETELLGRAAVELLSTSLLDRDRDLSVIDMCCGSGNLACAIASQVPRARIWATDLTGAAVQMTRRNVERLGVGDRVVVAQGDLFAPFVEFGLLGRIDLVVANPQYISSGRLANDRAELLLHEPREAFDGGPYGLTIHQRIIKEAFSFLRPGGTLMFEIGEGQERQATLLFQRARSYELVGPINDSAGHPRVMAGRKPEVGS
jgi:HemK-like putative methylase